MAVDDRGAGTWLLRDVIRQFGDDPMYDAAVRRILAMEDTVLIAFGSPASGDEPEGEPSFGSTAHLLHVDVDLANGTTIRLLPVFTDLERAERAVELNPAWGSLLPLSIEGWYALNDLEPGETLGIDIWTRGEFKLRPAA